MPSSPILGSSRCLKPIMWRALFHTDNDSEYYTLYRVFRNG